MLDYIQRGEAWADAKPIKSNHGNRSKSKMKWSDQFNDFEEALNQIRIPKDRSKQLSNQITFGFVLDSELDNKLI